MRCVATHGRAASPRGFTLVEMLLALLLMAMLTTGVYEVLGVARRAERKDRDRILLDQVGKVCLERIGRDIRAMVQDQSDLNPGLFGENSEVGLEGESHPGDFITFLTASAVAAAEDPNTVDETTSYDPDLTEVKYYVAADPEGEGQGLVRSVKCRLLHNLTNEDDAWEPQLLAEEVLGIDIRYFDGDAWTDDWDTETQEGYPAAVEVTLTVGRVRVEEGVWTALDPYGKPMARKVYRAVFPLRAVARSTAEDSENPAEALEGQ